MTPTPPTTISRWTDADRTGDLAGMRACLAADARLISPLTDGFSFHGAEEVMAVFAAAFELLDDIVIQKGEFDWRTLFTEGGMAEGALTRALGEFEDAEDAQAARVAAQEEMELEDEDAEDFGNEGRVEVRIVQPEHKVEVVEAPVQVSERALEGDAEQAGVDTEEGEEEEEEEGRTVDDYMIDFVKADPEFFNATDWVL